MILKLNGKYMVLVDHLCQELTQPKDFIQSY
jgi:hypothetical protein